MTWRPPDATEWAAQAAAAFADRNNRRKAAELANRKGNGSLAEAVLFARSAQGEAFDELCAAVDRLRALRSARAARAEAPPPPPPEAMQEDLGITLPPEGSAA